MKLLESVDCEKGITLNSQLVDLLSILDETSLSREEQDAEIERYIQDLKERQEKYELASSKGTGAKYLFLVESVIDELGLKTDEEKEKIKSIYLAGARDLSVCDKQKMLKVLNENGLSPEIHETIMRDLKTKDFTAKEGILDLDATKVRGLYSHLFENGNKYDRVTFDNVAKYSGYVSADGETYATDKMEKMQRFCEAHGMKTKINALMFYADFPKVYEQSLDNRVKNGIDTIIKDSQGLNSIAIVTHGNVHKSIFKNILNIDKKIENLEDVAITELEYNDENIIILETNGITYGEKIDIKNED